MSKIHQEVTLPGSPARIYRALTEAPEYARFSGAPADIEARAGGSFSGYGGQIVGRNLSLHPDTSLVQAWRVAGWPEGVYTIARFELRAEGSDTRLVFDQDAIPEGAQEHLEEGWPRMYWEPLRRYLST